MTYILNENENRRLNVKVAEEPRRTREYHYVFGTVGSKKTNSIELSSNKFALLRYCVRGRLDNFDYKGFSSLNEDCKSVIYDFVMKMKREEAAIRIQECWSIYQWKQYNYGRFKAPRWYIALEMSGY